MSNKSKCQQFGITIENVCLALAIINAIGAGLALVGSLIATFMFIVLYVQSSGNRNFADDSNFDVALVAYQSPITALAGIFLGVLALVCLIAFVFSALLCNGIYNRRPGQVKAYFIFGVVMTLLQVQVSAVSLFNNELRSGILGLLGCAVYSLFLVLVYRTYLKLTRDEMFKKHVRLLES